MRVVGVVLLPWSGCGDRTWRVTLSCGHHVDFATRARPPVRGMPRHRIYPCFRCLSERIAEVDRPSVASADASVDVPIVK